jgi:PIN domain nuclease of toxin-antitoxin system
MPPRFLLDTNILLRWWFEQRRLSREQLRILRHANRAAEAVAISAMTLLEIGALWGDGKLTLKTHLNEFLEQLESSPSIDVVPLSFEIASDVARLSALRDPADRAIVATARVHHLHLLTADQRIIESQLVPTIE